MLNKQTIVMTSVECDAKKAILTIEKKDDAVCGKLRLYGFENEPKGIVSLGIYYDGKVEKAGLTRSENMCYSFNCNFDEIPEVFSCAVVNIFNGRTQPILFGNAKGIADREEIFDSVADVLCHTESAAEIEEVLDQHGIDYDDELKDEIDKQINDSMKNCGGMCDECEYKKFYQLHHSNNQQYAEKLDSKKENEEALDKTFYQEIKNQIDKLFQENRAEEYLQSIIPSSKWVKVNEGEHAYVLGLIYDENKLKYICYGVPGVYQETPPKNLCGFPVWVALDQDNSQGFGYWLSYQDALTGQSVKAVII